MNSNKNNIYQLSREIEEEEQRKFEQQAKNIANAYRKVEQLKVIPHSLKEQAKKAKPQSNYAMKIKQTLKQINANKAKELQSISKYINQRTPISQTNLPNKLQRTATTNLLNLIQSYNARVTTESFRIFVTFCNEEQKKELYFIQKFRMYKLFRAWRDQILLQKIQREKKQKQQETLDLKSMEMAKEFRNFILVKKAMKVWESEAKKEVKRKKYQQQLLVAQTRQKIQEQKTIKRKKVEENSQLQNKVRGFLDGLKEKIEQKDRLKTIKQKTEQSRLNDNSLNYQQRHEEQISESQNEDQNDPIPQSVVIQAPVPQQQRKAMTNEELLRKRHQLEHKHKNRKQTLQKLRREKQQKKKQQQKQKNELQRQIEIQQKRIKQQKYREFLRAKQQQEEWQRKEKQLNSKAQAFNQYRIKKYYGWQPLTSIKKNQISKAAFLYQTLILILFRNKSSAFLNNLRVVSQQQLQQQQLKMKRRYELNMMRKAFMAVKKNREYQLQQKEEYVIMHEVNTLKIVFAQWKVAIPKLSAQNYDWERPRTKRAQQFQRLRLIHKGMRSLRLNKEASQRERCIAQQKHKIKNRIKDMLQESSQFNYQEFL